MLTQDLKTHMGVQLKKGDKFTAGRTDDCGDLKIKSLDDGSYVGYILQKDIGHLKVVDTAFGCVAFSIMSKDSTAHRRAAIAQETLPCKRVTQPTGWALAEGGNGEEMGGGGRELEEERRGGGRRYIQAHENTNQPTNLH